MTPFFGRYWWLSPFVLVLGIILRRLQLPADFSAQVPAEFIPGAGSPGRIRDHYIIDKLINHFFQKKHTGHPSILHIGPNDLPWEEELNSYIRAAALGSSMYFIEANARAVKNLQHRLVDAGVNASKVNVWNAAVCLDDESEKTSLDFHQWSDRLLADLPKLTNVTLRWLDHLSGIGENVVSRGSGLLRNFGMICFDLKGDCPNGFKEYVHEIIGQFDHRDRFYDFPWETYWEVVQVDCIHSDKILDTLYLQAQDLYYVIVDAEGLDSILLDKFMALEGFAPSIIQVEHDCANGQWAKSNRDSAHVLYHKGYRIHMGLTDFVWFLDPDGDLMPSLMNWTEYNYGERWTGCKVKDLLPNGSLPLQGD